MRKNTTFTIDENISKRLSIVSKKIKQSKSSIVEELLTEILPILEAETPNKILARSMKKMAETIDLTASLFDESLKDCKEIKKG